MTQDFSSLRSTEDIINALSTLYFNLNEIERIYYDMFLNPNPMDVTFQRYDDTGKLETITLPNRAKDVQATLTGNGNPNGVTSASVGTFYVDTNSYDLYYKSSGSDSQGWLLIWSNLNLVADTNFLAPNGDGSQLTNLNMTNAGSGVLNVLRGGTGSAGITGIVKGNGNAAMTAAIDGVDYMGPSSMTGIIAYYPVYKNRQNQVILPTGWLMCDGSPYSRITYAPLFAKIDTFYGAGDGSTTFNVPNLMNDGNGNPFFIRCWDGSTAFNTVQQAQVGVHNHALTGNVGEESAHTHTRGDMNITGTFRGINYGDSSDTFKPSSSNYGYADFNAPNGDVTKWTFDASKKWTGSTSGGTAHTHSLDGLSTSDNTTASGNENRVLNKMLVPVIKY